jgi:hypothetical protein
MTIRSTLGCMIVLAACMTAAAPAYAEEETDDVGNILHMTCTSPDEQVETGCLQSLGGFLAGWTAAVEQIASKTNVPARSLLGFCLTDGASLGDVRDALVKGLEAMPDNGRNENGNLAMIAILSKAYPCDSPETPAQ